MPVKSELNSAIDLQMFSVITAVKNGTTAVKNRIVLRRVHFPEKHAIAAKNKKTGTRTLENPYTETSMEPSKNKRLPSPFPYAIKSKGCSMSETEKKAAINSKSMPAAYFGLFKRSIDTPVKPCTESRNKAQFPLRLRYGAAVKDRGVSLFVLKYRQIFRSVLVENFGRFVYNAGTGGYCGKSI